MARDRRRWCSVLGPATRRRRGVAAGGAAACMAQHTPPILGDEAINGSDLVLRSSRPPIPAGCRLQCSESEVALAY
jgi:hypothetical protein